MQGYDRYAYVNNDPVRYTDPTGHKCHPEDDCKSQDTLTAQQKLSNTISAVFPNVRIGTPNLFKVNELQELYDTLLILRSEFEGQENVTKAFSNLNFNVVDRSHFADPNDVAESVWNNGTINLSHDAFNSSLGKGWYILHEIGHRFDYINSGGDPAKYKSQTFVNIFMGGNCSLGYYGCTNYSPSDNETTVRGQENSVEDFADVFAVTVLYGGPFRSMKSTTRLTIMEAYIDIYSGNDYPR